MMFVRFVIAVVLATVAPTAASAMPFVNPTNGHSYLITPTPMSWLDAEAFAIGVGGHLTAINDANELNWILDTLPLPAMWVWIGGHDQAIPDWIWTTGEPFTYTNWNVGEPDNVPSSLGEGYAAMWTVTNVSDNTTPHLGRRGRWLDLAARDGEYFGVVEIVSPAGIPEPSVLSFAAIVGLSLTALHRRRG